MTLVASLGLIEITAATIEHRPKIDTIAAVAEQRHVPWDRTTEWDVVSRLRAAGHDPYPIVGPVMFLLTDGIGTSDGRIVPISLASTTEYVVRSDNGGAFATRTDRHGFRNDDAAWDRPIDAVIIGNSFAFGSGLTDEQTIPSLIADTGKNVVTLGTGGSGPLFALAQAAEYARFLRPGGHIIWLYDEDHDPGALCNEISSKQLSRYLEPQFIQDVIGHQAEIDAAYKERVKPLKDEWGSGTLAAHLTRPRELFDLVTLGHLRRYLGRANGDSPPHNNLSTAPCYSNGGWTRYGEFRTIANRITEIAEANQATAALIVLPSWEKIKGLENANFRITAENLKIAKEMGIDTFVPESQGTVIETFPMGQRAHYTPRGYCMLAKSVSTIIAAPEVRCE